MTPDEKPLNATPGEKSPAEIRSEIDQTREELGDTVEALARKTDVKAQAKAKVEDVKAGAKAAAQQVQAKARRDPRPFAIVGGIVALFLLWRWLRS